MLAYTEQYVEYDPFLTAPDPSNPWISDDATLWELEARWGSEERRVGKEWWGGGGGGELEARWVHEKRNMRRWKHTMIDVLFFLEFILKDMLCVCVLLQ